MPNYEILNMRNDHLCYQQAESEKDAIATARMYGIKTAVRAREVTHHKYLNEAIEYAHKRNRKAKISKARREGWRVTMMEISK